MANVFAQNHWVLDTAVDATPDRIWIRKLRWVPSASADDLTILDKHDETIWDVDALAGGSAGTEELDFGSGGHSFPGFNLSVIDGGLLYVYFR